MTKIHFFVKKGLIFDFSCLLKALKNNTKIQHICRHCHILKQFFRTASQAKLGYYHQKVNERATSRVTKGLKTQDLRKLENIKTEMLAFNGAYPSHHFKDKFWHLSLKIAKSAVEYSVRKSSLHIFVCLSTPFCARFFQEKAFSF